MSKKDQNNAMGILIRSLVTGCRPNPAMPKGWVLNPDKSRAEYVLYIVAGLPAAYVSSHDGTSWYWKIVGQPKAGNIESPAPGAPEAAREAMQELHRVWTGALETLASAMLLKS